MGQQAPPLDTNYKFGGVISAGHKLRRPKDSAIVCQNFRVMPGNWLRLRSGRTFRLGSGTSYQRFHEFRKSGGGLFNLVQHNDSGTYKWKKLDLSTYLLTELETIDQTKGYGPGNWAAICSMRQRVAWYNGLGVRPTAGSGESKPPLSSWDGTTVRYVGLDAFCPGGTNPTAAFTAGSGQVTMVYTRDFYVALYNATTGQISNGLLCGTHDANGAVLANGTIAFTNLTRLTFAYHNTTERDEIYYVYFITLDGGKVPYLLINQDGSGPTKTLCNTVGATVTLGSSQFVLDTTQEMPISNFPPRPIQDMTYANGRIYYSILPTAGSGSPFRDFSYVTSIKSVAAVGWTAAADDQVNRSFCGVPEESFPLNNFKYTPNGEDPVIIEASQDDNRVLVVTKTGTFLLEEYVDGLHQWRTISWVDGAWNNRSFVRTSYGSMWLTQKRELVILQPGSMSLDRVNSDYADLFNVNLASTAPADYILDPLRQIDRYQIYLGNGTSVVHDFWIGGQAYTETNQSVDACKTMLDSSGAQHSLITIGASLFTHEADPATGVIPVSDAGSEFTGTYIGQWQADKDSGVRKENHSIDVIGDGATSTQLAGSPLAVTWFGDMSGTEKTPASVVKRDQSTTDNAYRYILSSANRFWFKLKMVLRSHSADAGATYAYNPTSDGDAAVSVYGSVFEVNRNGSDRSGNRP